MTCSDMSWLYWCTQTCSPNFLSNMCCYYQCNCVIKSCMCYFLVIESKWRAWESNRDRENLVPSVCFAWLEGVFQRLHICTQDCRENGRRRAFSWPADGLLGNSSNWWRNYRYQSSSGSSGVLVLCLDVMPQCIAFSPLLCLKYVIMTLIYLGNDINWSPYSILHRHSQDHLRIKDTFSVDSGHRRAQEHILQVTDTRKLAERFIS